MSRRRSELWLTRSSAGWFMAASYRRTLARLEWHRLQEGLIKFISWIRLSPRSAALRAEPQDPLNTRLQPAKWATAYSLTVTCNVWAIAPSARLNFIIVANLGFRSQSLAPPQALRYRRAPRA